MQPRKPDDGVRSGVIGFRLDDTTIGESEKTEGRACGEGGELLDCTFFEADR